MFGICLQVTGRSQKCLSASQNALSRGIRQLLFGIDPSADVNTELICDFPGIVRTVQFSRKPRRTPTIARPMSLHSADVTHRDCDLGHAASLLFTLFIFRPTCTHRFVIFLPVLPQSTALSASCRHNKLKTIKQLLTSQRHLEINNTCLKFLAVGFMNSFEVFVSVDNFLQYLQWGLTDIRRRE